MDTVSVEQQRAIYRYRHYRTRCSPLPQNVRRVALAPGFSPGRRLLPRPRTESVNLPRLFIRFIGTCRDGLPFLLRYRDTPCFGAWRPRLYSSLKYRGIREGWHANYTKSPRARAIGYRGICKQSLSRRRFDLPNSRDNDVVERLLYVVTKTKKRQHVLRYNNKYFLQ
jgi:hypothetical protein